MSGLSVEDLGILCPSSAVGERWQELTRTNPASGFMQSLHWAEAKRRQGLTTFHLGLFEDGNLIGGAIFYSSGGRSGAGIVVAPEGPVLPWHNQRIASQGLGLLIEAVRERSQALGVMTMRIEPRLAPPVPPVLREFSRAPLDLVPRDTLYVDLCDDESVQLGRMKEKGRYNIKLAQKHGVVISEHSSPASLNKFYDILTEAGERDAFAVEPQEFFEQMLPVLMQNGMAKILLAEHGDDTLGALLLITHGARATYLYGGISNDKRNLMGGYLLQWRAMQLAKQAGCTTYDFYGYAPFRAPELAYSRFSQFKSQFGGNAIRWIGAQDYFFLDNVADAFVKVVNESDAGMRARKEGVYA
ncbi:MAG: peptidoglycan bridge formation glycyltransferase FemA/FemB family protein [Cyanobacteria bacterium SZAS LIN-3]|nr:peptidoglycan bridge formation glycyltransferase FemA/FemB family protein [Cyanobacteria bacterium SZAS LIN-3]